MTYIYNSFYCAVCSSDAAGKKLDLKTSKYTFAQRMLKKKERGQPGLTLENIEKPLIHFASPRPRKTIELFEKALPFPENH